MNTEIIPQTKIVVNSDDEVIVRKRSKTHIPFNMVGNGKMNKQGTKSINLLREMETLSKPAIKLLNDLIDGMSYNPDTEQVGYIVFYKADTNAEAMVIKRGYKELKARGLAIRVKRSHYILNPYAIITSNPMHIPDWHKAVAD